MIYGAGVLISHLFILGFNVSSTNNKHFSITFFHPNNILNSCTQ